MTETWGRLARRTRAERHVIATLRYAPDPANWSQESGALLRAQSLAVGYRLLDPQTPFVGCDELKLLGWIALLQRERRANSNLVDARLREAITQYAADVKKKVGLLPFEAATRAIALCAETSATTP